jgi:murein L,D-transpeptidase YafK
MQLNYKRTDPTQLYLLPELAPSRWWQLGRRWQERRAAQKRYVSDGITPKQLGLACGLVGITLLAVLTPSIANQIKPSNQPNFKPIKGIDIGALTSNKSQRAPLQAPQSHSEAEVLLLTALKAMREGDLKTAESHADAAIAKFPNYRLAHLLKGDILQARFKPLSKLGDAADESDALNGLRAEAKVRGLQLTNQKPQGVLAHVLKLPPAVQYAVAVDLEQARLYVLEHTEQGLKPILDMYTTIGKAGGFKVKEGDVKTPVGYYTLLGSVAKEKLTDFYGLGAYPIDYPNEWDKLNGRSGHGIWIHGVPSTTFARSPRASDGCIVVSNSDLTILQRYITPGQTPMLIAANLQWQKEAVNSDHFDKQLEQWRTAWAAPNADKLLAFYSPELVVDSGDATAWREKKRQLIEQKASIKLSLSDVAIARYPGADNIMVVSFTQAAPGGPAALTGRKKQYWQQASKTQQWTIIYEGNA